MEQVCPLRGAPHLSQVPPQKSTLVRPVRELHKRVRSIHDLHLYSWFGLWICHKAVMVVCSRCFLLYTTLRRLYANEHACYLSRQALVLSQTFRAGEHMCLLPDTSCQHPSHLHASSPVRACFIPHHCVGHLCISLFFTDSKTSILVLNKLALCDDANVEILWYIQGLTMLRWRSCLEKAAAA